jgi:hypothetical protein
MQIAAAHPRSPKGDHDLTRPRHRVREVAQLHRTVSQEDGSSHLLLLKFR